MSEHGEAISCFQSVIYEDKSFSNVRLSYVTVSSHSAYRSLKHLLTFSILRFKLDSTLENDPEKSCKEADLLLGMRAENQSSVQGAKFVKPSAAHQSFIKQLTEGRHLRFFFRIVNIISPMVQWFLIWFF